MYLLFLLCSFIKGNAGRKEAMFDLYVVAILLSLLPSKFRFYVRIPLYVLAYSISLVDIYCFDNFGTALNPSLLMLVSETNMSEASNFFSSVFSISALGNHVWMILALLVCHIAAFIERKKMITLVPEKFSLLDCTRKYVFVAKSAFAVVLLLMVIRGGKLAGIMIG